MIKAVYRKRLPNDAATVLEALAPYRDRLTGSVVESIYNGRVFVAHPGDDLPPLPKLHTLSTELQSGCVVAWGMAPGRAEPSLSIIDPGAG